MSGPTAPGPSSQLRERPGNHCSPEQRWRGTPALPLEVQVRQSTSTCRLTAAKAITRATSYSPPGFIINYCLANKGRFWLKNTGDLKVGGISRTRVDLQPLTPTINILLAAGLTATTIPAPSLGKELQAISPKKVSTTTYGKNDGMCLASHAFHSPLVHTWFPIYKDQRRL